MWIGEPELHHANRHAGNWQCCSTDACMYRLAVLDKFVCLAVGTTSGCLAVRAAHGLMVTPTENAVWLAMAMLSSQRKVPEYCRWQD